MLRRLEPIAVCTNAGHSTDTPTPVSVICISFASVSDNATTPYFDTLYGPISGADA